MMTCDMIPHLPAPTSPYHHRAHCRSQPTCGFIFNQQTDILADDDPRRTWRWRRRTRSTRPELDTHARTHAPAIGSRSTTRRRGGQRKRMNERGRQEGSPVQPHRKSWAWNALAATSTASGLFGLPLPLQGAIPQKSLSLPIRPGVLRTGNSSTAPPFRTREPGDRFFNRDRPTRCACAQTALAPFPVYASLCAFVVGVG